MKKRLKKKLAKQQATQNQHTKNQFTPLSAECMEEIKHCCSLYEKAGYLPFFQRTLSDTLQRTIATIITADTLDYHFADKAQVDDIFHLFKKMPLAQLTELAHYARTLDKNNDKDNLAYALQITDIMQNHATKQNRLKTLRSFAILGTLFATAMTARNIVKDTPAQSLKPAVATVLFAGAAAHAASKKHTLDKKLPALQTELQQRFPEIYTHYRHIQNFNT